MPQPSEVVEAAERAGFLIRTSYWWGCTMAVLGGGGHIVAVAALEGATDPSGVVLWSRVLLLLCLVGLVVLSVGLTATGVRLGLAAHGVPPGRPDDDPTGR